MPFPLQQLYGDALPYLLQEIPDCPKRLYYKGALPPKAHKLLCVVGSRRTTPYGERSTRQLIAGLSGQPISIVSGLALGTDANAHTAALDAGLHTIAVLPSGLDAQAIYPSTNRALAQRILTKGGALMSENEPECKPMLHSFPERNRVMAGMSHAILVIEASEKSGTLITARLALDYNRDVLGIPHELGKESGLGVNRLLREGATLVRDSADILEALGLQVSAAQEQLPLPNDLTATELAVLTALSEPLTQDEIIIACSLPTRDIHIALSALTLRGLIDEHFGKHHRT